MSLHRSLVLLLLGWATATAQQPAEAPPVPVTPAPAQPTPAPATPAPATPRPLPTRPVTPVPPGVPVPGAPVQPAAGAPGLRPANAANAAVANPAIPIGENKIVEDIIEPKLSGNALAGLYRKYTGRRVIVSAGAAAAEFSFVQEASPQDPLTYAEAAELLRKAAVIESFVFQEHPQDPNLDILTLATGGIRPTGVDVNVFNENTPLPETDIVITYVMTLSHIKPDQAVNVFTQIVGQFGAYGSIAAVANASAVVITEKASLIKSLIELKKSIDVPGSVQSSRFIKVQFADVTEIAATLTELLTAQQSTQKTAGVQRTDPGGAAPNPAAAAMAGQTGSGGAGEDTPVQIIAEPRTNRIFAMGRPVDLLFVEGLVREFDVPSTEKTFMRRKLRFLTVSGFLPIAGEAITRAFSGTGDSGGGTSGGSAAAGGGASTNNRTQSSNRSSSGTSRSSRTSSGSSSSGFGNNSSGMGGGSSGFGGGGGSSFGGSGGLGGGSAFSGSAPSSEPESMLVGRTLLVADNITNSIVAQGPPPALEIIERLLDQIDVRPDQVLISTVIGQLTLDKSNDTGFSYLYRGNDILSGAGAAFPGFIKAASGTGTGGNTTNGLNVLPKFDRSALLKGGLSGYGTVGNLDIFLKALQSKSDFTVLSRPTIFTSNNQPGSISSGERIAIPTGSTNYGSSNNASTQIEYQDVVLKLEVQPLVNSDKEITMQISLLNDEQNGTQTIEGGAGGGGNLTVPKISTRELLTTVTVPNNQTIVLGGLIVGRNGKGRTGIPILSDIPYLGYLFGTTADTSTRSELMVFIQPSIVRNDVTLNDAQQDMDSRYKITPDARKFADGNGVLPGPNEIPRVEEKGKGGSTYVTEPAQPSANSTVKPSIRPTHKR